VRVAVAALREGWGRVCDVESALAYAAFLISFAEIPSNSSLDYILAVGRELS